MKQQISLRLYAYLKKYLKPEVFHHVGKSSILKPIRNLFLYKNKKLLIAKEIVRFENLSFYFEAPVKVLNHAKNTGIEARISRVAMSQLNPGSIAIDVGANYGFISLVMAKCVQPTGKVVSFEPDNHIKQVLENNIHNNGLDETCLLIDQFAGKPESAGFITIDEVLRINNFKKPDFLKIDVDGGDFEVLLGSENMLSKHHPVLVIEMGVNQIDIFNFLREIGYVYFMGMEGEEVISPDFPLNLFASITPISIPKRGSFM